MKSKVLLVVVLVLFCACCVGCEKTQPEVTSPESGTQQDVNASNYEIAEKLFNERKYVDALRYYRTVEKGYSDTEEKIQQAEKEIDQIKDRSSTFILDDAIGYINEKHEFTFVGTSSPLNDIHLNNLKQVVASETYVIGLHNDGTVEVVGAFQSDLLKKFNIQAKSREYIEAISQWQDIQKIVMDENDIVAGLKNDGTIVYTIDPELDSVAYTPSLSVCSGWTEIKDIAVTKSYGIWGLKNTNELLYSNETYSGDYKDVVSVSADSFVAIASKDTLTVRGLFTSRPEVKQPNIQQCSVGKYIVGILYNDGHLKIWSIDKGLMEVEGLDNVVSVNACGEIITAYQSDGTLNIIGDFPATSTDKVNVIKMKFFDEKSDNSVNPPNTKKEPLVGMTKEEVLNSTWGSPSKKNITEYSWGTKEQWVYSNYRYIYFENGIVTAIQKSE